MKIAAPGHRHLPGPQFRHPQDRDRPGRLRHRRRHAQRPRAGGGRLSRRTTSCPALIGRDARRIEDIWQYLYRGAYWRRGPVTMTRDRRGRHGAVGHQGQGRRPAALPAARRASRDGVHGLRPCQRQRHRRDRRRGRRATSSSATRRSARRRGVPGLTSTYGVGQGQALLRAGRRGAADRERLVDRRSTSTIVPKLFERCARDARLRRPPAARRPPPPDADRGRAGSARSSSRTGCSGWRTRRRPRTRKRSA